MSIKLLLNVVNVHLLQDASIVSPTSQQSASFVPQDFILIQTQHAQHALCSVKLAHLQLFAPAYSLQLDILLFLPIINQPLEFVTLDVTSALPLFLVHAQSVFLDFISLLLPTMVILESVCLAIPAATIVSLIPLIIVHHASLEPIW